jgi:hypothetical protein
MVDSSAEYTWQMFDDFNESTSQWEHTTITKINDGVPCLHLSFDETIFNNVLEKKSKTF